jgi:uncharacterized protein
MLWLILIGLLHAYVFWYGDILVLYGTCGLLIYLFRRFRPRWLVAIGLVGIVIPMALSLFFGLSLPHFPEPTRQDMIASWQPPPEVLDEEIAAYRGGWWAQMAHRVPTALAFQTVFTVLFSLWRAAGVMLLGMALFKWGVLTGERPRRFYRGLAAGGLSVGLALAAYGLYRHTEAGWSFPYSMFFGEMYNYWGSLAVSLGYVGLVVLACRAPRLAAALRPVAAVGRTAFSNYLFQTLLCTTLFYGHGFGLFGRVDRVGQLLVVLAVWAVELIVSPRWLRAYRFGPAEWLWRSLTYRRLQPMRQERPPGEPAVA